MLEKHSNRTFRSAAIILIAAGVLRIAATWTTFSEGIDEPIHLASGIEMLTRHQYKLHVVNPPLPRLAFAIGPWLDGMTLNGLDPVYSNLTRVFHSGRGYLRTLALSRAGNLIFFLIGAIAMWMWARREAGDVVAIIALLLFTTQPIILGWFGLVTHDGPATTGVAVSLLALSRWLERPTTNRALLLGVAYGFAIACKFTCLLFVPLACIAIVLVRWRPIAWRTIVLVPLSAAAVIFAVYAPFGIDRFVDGIRDVIKISNGPTQSYLFGAVRTTGWCWYFPAALLLKTTLPVVILLIAGFFVTRTRVFFASIAAAGAMLAVALPSHLDIGVRYVLPLMVPLSLAAAIALVELYARKRVVALILIVWQVGTSAIAHPDYFPYFNELAGRDPSRYLVDSNLDWGQDVLRLAHVVHQLKIGTMGIALFGNVDLDALGFPQRHWLNAFSPERGWIAISDQAYRMEMTRGGWWWLRNRPYQRVGKSIRLYHE
ncbi:MAG: glycosyltransferase family 39 protein [Acidobacteriota bacterium]|nr:glycosyltransferase family 39 protein [Acidobacteriota bacterium]